MNADDEFWTYEAKDRETFFVATRRGCLAQLEPGDMEIGAHVKGARNVVRYLRDLPSCRVVRLASIDMLPEG